MAGAHIGRANGDFLAEREGFEPSVPVTQYARLAIWCLRPLGHLSARAAVRRRGAKSLRTCGRSRNRASATPPGCERTSALIGPPRRVRRALIPSTPVDGLGSSARRLRVYHSFRPAIARTFRHGRRSMLASRRRAESSPLALREKAPLTERNAALMRNSC